MSDEQEPPDEPGGAQDKAPDAAEHERPEGSGKAKKEGKRSDDPSYFESLEKDDNDRRRRSESLHGMFGVGSAEAGRDWIGQVTNRVSSGNVNHIGGDVTFNLLDETRMDVSYLPHGAVEAWLECFVPPRSYQRLSQQVGRDPMVFLRGPAGTGRTTTALAALTGWLRSSASSPGTEDEERIGWLPSLGAMGRARLPALRRGHGYLLDGADGGSARDLARLRDLVVKSESRLIVLVQRESANLPGTLVDHEPPSAVEVFRRHLDSEGRVAGIDAQLPEEILKEITEDLEGEKSPRRAIAQASDVVQALKEDRPFEELLDELPGRLSEHIRGRLDQGQPIIGRCFMAGVAVLHDLPEVIVSEAALRLADHIYEAWHIKKVNRTPPTWEQLGAWLEYAGATAHTSGRAGGGRIVRLNRRKAPAATIRVLWEDHPTIREPLMRWLGELGGHSDTAVQINAAHAVGKLATFDFPAIQRRFLTPWSTSRKTRDHRLAALAFEAAAQDPRMASRVHAHLRKLAASDRYGPRAVAIQAYGSSIGLNAVGEALQALRRISIVPVIPLNRQAAWSVTHLFTARTAQTIVRELASWVNTGSSGGRHTAALAFVRLAMGENGRALADLDMTGELVLLWQNALTLRIIPPGAERSRPAVPPAWAVFGEWVSRYDTLPAARGVIDQVLGTADTAAAQLYLRLWERRERISKERYAYFTHLVQKG
jgi:hypothetical protein